MRKKELIDGPKGGTARLCQMWLLFFVAAFLLVGGSGHWAIAAGTEDPTSDDEYERRRFRQLLDLVDDLDQKDRKEPSAEEMTDVLDLATPDELAELFDLPPTGEILDDDGDVDDWDVSGFRLFDVGRRRSERPVDGVHIKVSIAKQRLTVTTPDREFTVKVSTGRKKYPTKKGCFTKPRLKKMHYSQKYQNSPMPYSIFYYGGFAIHGTNYESKLGSPASHGCVRVSKANARLIFDIVKSYGPENTLICVAA